MHIPNGTAENWKIDTFELALAAALQPHTEYDSEKWLYVPDHYTEYRYILGTRGEKPLICIGINPSTAMPEKLDNTLKSVARVAQYNGYDSFIMFNVSPQRATRPEDMERRECELLRHENLCAFRWALSQCGERPAIWAAWGTNVARRAYLPDCMRELADAGKEADAVWYCAGAPTAAGHPRHPLYLNHETPLAVFDMEAYLTLL